MVLRSEGSLKLEMLSLTRTSKYVENTSVLSINKTEEPSQLRLKRFIRLDSYCVVINSDRQNNCYATSTVNTYILINIERVSKHSVNIHGLRVVTTSGLEPGQIVLPPPSE